MITVLVVMSIREPREGGRYLGGVSSVTWSDVDRVKSDVVLVS